MDDRLGEVLAAIHNAGRSSTTLTAIVLQRIDEHGRRESFRRFVERRQRASAGHGAVTATVTAVASAPASPAPRINEETTRLYALRPERLRLETLSGRFAGSLLIARGGRWWWQQTGETTARTGLEPNARHGSVDGARLLTDPSAVLALPAASVLGRTSVEGRHAVQLRIDEDADPMSSAHALADVVPRGDLYHVDVDAELGILLRCAAVLDGEEFAVVELRDVRVDTVLDDALFEFSGTAIDLADEHPRHVTAPIELVGSLVDFTVFEVWPAPDVDGAVAHVDLPPTHPRAGWEHPSVHVHYMPSALQTGKAPQALRLRQQSAVVPHAVLTNATREAVGRDGVEAYVETVHLPDGSPAQCTVVAERAGTRVRLSGLDVDELLKAAASLRPVPPGPPPLVEVGE